ncbi:MAG: hypothetical protein ABGX20_05655 [Bacillus sp. (in: firmicutes)]
MQWKGRRQSSNVEDRRGMGMGGRTVFGCGIGSIIMFSSLHCSVVIQEI